jgi:hypothetical protein
MSGPNLLAQDRARAAERLRVLHIGWVMGSCGGDLAHPLAVAPFYSRDVPGWCWVPRHSLALRVPLWGPPTWRPGFGEEAAAARLSSAA